MMSKVLTDITFTVYSDTDYRYEVTFGSLMSVDYVEGDRRTHIGFGSRDEMIAVANAMLKAAEFQ